MRVHEAMTREVRAVVEGETIAFARAALVFSSFRHQLVGILTDVEVLGALAAHRASGGGES